jgi:hypothetical protein
MPASALRSFQLVGAQTVDVVTQTAQIYGITINCESDGQHIEIRDKGAPPKKLIGSFALKVEPLAADPLWMTNPHIYEWSNGKIMDGGITIQTTGTGTVSVWIDYQTAPLGST